MKRSPILIVFLIALLIGVGFLLPYVKNWMDHKQVEKSELDKIVVALREDRNRLEIQKISGEVTTVRSVEGGLFNVLRGTIKVRQPYSVTYFVDMKDVSLDSYIWDSSTRTLIVKTPLPGADFPNVDASRQIVVTQGAWITRDMQDRMRAEIAKGARQQAIDEAAKPENLAAASKAARDAIVEDVRKPLRAVGLSDVTVIATDPTTGSLKNGDHWDISRSIAEVLGRR